MDAKITEYRSHTFCGISFIAECSPDLCEVSAPIRMSFKYVRRKHPVSMVLPFKTLGFDTGGSIVIEGIKITLNTKEIVSIEAPPRRKGVKYIITTYDVVLTIKIQDIVKDDIRIVITF